jgi:hypothetical protein
LLQMPEMPKDDPYTKIYETKNQSEDTTKNLMRVNKIQTWI